MNEQAFATQLKSDIRDLKAKGIVAILCDDLVAYLEKVEQNPALAPEQHEQYKARNTSPVCNRLYWQRG